MNISTAVADIDLAALRQNTHRLAEEAKPARIMAVVKADAYGHGSVRVAKTLAEEGIEWFAVATVREGIELREAGIDRPILVLGALLPDSVEAYHEYALDATIGSDAGLKAALAHTGPKLRAHLKVDTGMGRIGLDPEQAQEALTGLRSATAVDLIGVSTHLSSADDDDLEYTESQIARFRDFLTDDIARDLVVHFENTEALARLHPAAVEFPNWVVRLGIGLYGCPIRIDTRDSLDLVPVMSVRARVTNIKKVGAGTPISYSRRWTAEHPTYIATVGIGYADGYPRSVAGKAQVGVDGLLRPVVGTICMDMIMVDLGPEQPQISVGDYVTLFGRGGPDVGQVAAWGNTISYEVVCGVGRRVKRRYS